MLIPQSRLNLKASDLNILSALQADGRMPKVKLAELVGLSPTPCGVRIEKLEKAGLIRGYHADINIAQLARLQRFRVTISMRNWNPPKSKLFESAVARMPNIVECEAVLGDIDYVLTVLAGSISHYEEILGGLLGVFPDEIDYTTYPVSKPIKRECDLTLLKLANEGDQL